MVSVWDLVFWAAVTFATPLIIALAPVFKFKASERVLHLMLGFSAGVLTSVTFVDILPEAFDAAKQMSFIPAYVSSGVATGFFLMLVVERYLLSTDEIHGGHFHIHQKPVLDPRHGLMGVSALTFHGFMDGFVIPVSFSAGPGVGLVVTLAVAIHQIPDSFAALSLALGSTESRKQALAYVFATAADTPIGIAIGGLALGLSALTVPIGLGLSAGTFVYISATDLVPELQHGSRSPLVVVSMVAGFLLILAISLLLPAT